MLKFYDLKKMEKGEFLGQFFTHPDVVDECIKIVEEVLPRDRKKMLFIEPSAGQGVFVDGLKDHGYKNVIGIEADPKLAKQFAKQIQIYAPLKNGGFLGLDASDIYNTKKWSPNQVVCIGNPPFSNPRASGNDRGHFSNLALKFINHIAEQEIADTIAFVLPASFRRPLLQKKIHKHLQLVIDETLDESVPFLQNSTQGLKPVKKNCIFMVWQVERDPKTGEPIERVEQNTNLFEWDKKNKGCWIDKKTGKPGPFQFVNNIDPKAQLAIYKWGTLKRLGDILGPTETKKKVKENQKKYEQTNVKTGGTVYYLHCPKTTDVSRVQKIFVQKKKKFEEMGLDRSHNFSSIDCTRDDCVNIFLSK